MKIIVAAAQEKVKQWIEDNNFPFPVLADPQLHFYRELGLRSSLNKVLKLELLAKYAANIVANVPFKVSSPEPGDNVYMMVGDFIADSSGKLVYAYHAQHAHDRPSVEEILSTVTV